MSVIRFLFLLFFALGFVHCTKRPEASLSETNRGGGDGDAAIVGGGDESLLLTKELKLIESSLIRLEDQNELKRLCQYYDVWDEDKFYHQLSPLKDSDLAKHCVQYLLSALRSLKVKLFLEPAKITLSKDILTHNASEVGGKVYPPSEEFPRGHIELSIPWRTTLGRSYIYVLIHELFHLISNNYNDDSEYHYDLKLGQYFTLLGIAFQAYIYYEIEAELTATQLDEKYDFFAHTHFFFDTYGKKGKWFIGKEKYGNPYYVLIPGAKLIKWDGVSGDTSGDTIATLGNSFYEKPETLYDAFQVQGKLPTKLIYRLKNNRPNHVSVERSEFDSYDKQKYVWNGRYYRLFAQSVSVNCQTLAPLYRCKQNNGNQFLSLQANCEGATVEKILGLIAPKPFTASEPLFVCFHSGNADSMSSTESLECANKLYSLRQILGYVPSVENVTESDVCP